MESNINGKQYKWKAIKMERNINGKQYKWKGT